jgi:rod shape-determining protein MreC
MPLGTLDRRAPPFFRHGPSALSTVVFLTALSLFLMVADARLGITPPLRSAISTVLYPVQWLVTQPVALVRRTSAYFDTIRSVQDSEDMVRRQMLQQAQRSSQVEELMLENERLRGLLGLRDRIVAPEQVAEVLYDAPDPYTRRVVIDRGMTQGIVLGSPVIDELGVLGQVTRVYPFLAEVTLVIDREFAIPVLNSRTGERSVAFGDPAGGSDGALELRFMPGDADVQKGDLLTTSGVDGVYPAGLAVARVDMVERRSDTAFAKIRCVPLARVHGARHVMVLKPLTDQFAQLPGSPGVPDDAGSKKVSKSAKGGNGAAATAAVGSGAVAGVAVTAEKPAGSATPSAHASTPKSNTKPLAPVRKGAEASHGKEPMRRPSSSSAKKASVPSTTGARDEALGRPAPPRSRPHARASAPSKAEVGAQQ